MDEDDRRGGRRNAPRLLPGVQHAADEGMRAMKRLTYQRIMRAARRGTGLRLSEDEVCEMSRDTAISQLAENDDDPESAALDTEIAMMRCQHPGHAPGEE